MNKTTCGPLYLSGLIHFCGGDLEKQKLFAAGFISGEAEKIYLGACHAAMFHPDPEYMDWIRGIVANVASRYGLSSVVINDEVWICKTESYDLMLELEEMERDSKAWHLLRANLTGVPLSEVDFEFHLRKDYGEKCDLTNEDQ